MLGKRCDGRTDLATGNNFSSDVTLLANTTKQASSAALTARRTSSRFGRAVRFTTPVAEKIPQRGAPTATGTVVYTVDGVALAPTTLAGGSASLRARARALAAGTHAITAAYSAPVASIAAGAGSRSVRRDGPVWLVDRQW
jgi:hypothetical protein